MKSIAQTLAWKGVRSPKERGYIKVTSRVCQDLILKELRSLNSPVSMDRLLGGLIYDLRRTGPDFRAVLEATFLLMVERGIIFKTKMEDREIYPDEPWNYLYWMDPLQKLAAL